MGQHGIDLARLGDEVTAREQPVAIIACDFAQESFELLDIAIHGLPELRLTGVFALDLLERSAVPAGCRSRA